MLLIILINKNILNYSGFPMSKDIRIILDNYYFE